LEEHAGWLARAAALDAPGAGIGRGGVNPRAAQRLGVDPEAMVVVAGQRNGMLRRGVVERGFAGEALRRPLVFVPAMADDPRAGRLRGSPRLDQRHRLIFRTRLT